MIRGKQQLLQASDQIPAVEIWFYMLCHVIAHGGVDSQQVDIGNRYVSTQHALFKGRIRLKPGIETEQLARGQHHCRGNSRQGAGQSPPWNV